MPGHGGRKKIRLEMVDDEGDKLVLIFEGRLSREKLMQMADLLELYGGLGGREQEEEQYYENSKLSKLARILAKYFPFGYFTSRDVVEAYMTEYREPITLSTASTYLARLAEKGYLEKYRSGNQIRYRLAQPRIPAGDENAATRSSWYDAGPEAREQ
ncbi:MAG: BlaI/MecI/CopY family transcriptional regulator [Nitrososphaerota archaeon]